MRGGGEGRGGGGGGRGGENSSHTTYVRTYKVNVVN